MPDKVHSDFHACPACNGKGEVASRLPGRTRPCDWCRGGIVTPLRRQTLLIRKQDQLEEMRAAMEIHRRAWKRRSPK
jgi:DnaJ-class molecular chaperone